MSIVPTHQICLLNERHVAATLSVSLATVRRWRLYGRGPKFIKVGAAVRYVQQDFERWLASRPAGGESAAKVANE
jgi:predicted DNA-binding transcriptional regulator AlpA